MEKLFITIAGLNFYFGLDFIEKGMVFSLKKDPENEYDKEAIKVEAEGLGTIGHVANSARTVLGESHSAGYIYDKVNDDTRVRVLYVLEDRNAVICEVINQYED